MSEKRKDTKGRGLRKLKKSGRSCTVYYTTYYYTTYYTICPKTYVDV